MKRSILLLVVLFLFVGAAFLRAEEGVEDLSVPVLKEYKVRKGLVKFPHAKHFLDYQIKCSACHHEKKIKEGDKLIPVPLSLKKVEELKAQGKDPFRCKSCHGDLKRKDFRKLFHKNCLRCHKALKAEGKKAPTKCRDCHIKPKKRRPMVEGC